jgi:diaphanous 1
LNSLTCNLVSVDTITQTVDSFQLGLQKIKIEIDQLQEIQGVAPNDRFIVVMEVSGVLFLARLALTFLWKPYIAEQTPRVEAIKNMVTLLQKDLKSLLSFYGEKVDSPEAPKYEDFFRMIASFSSSLQVRSFLF